MNRNQFNLLQKRISQIELALSLNFWTIKSRAEILYEKQKLIEKREKHLVENAGVVV